MFGVNFGFKVNIFDEISWQKFQLLPTMTKLPLNEQVRKYNQYINQIGFERSQYLNWLEGHKKGANRQLELDGNFLLQEDFDFLLQEDGSKIIIT